MGEKIEPNPKQWIEPDPKQWLKPNGDGEEIKTSPTINPVRSKIEPNPKQWLEPNRDTSDTDDNFRKEKITQKTKIQPMGENIPVDNNDDDNDHEDVHGEHDYEEAHEHDYGHGKEDDPQDHYTPPDGDGLGEHQINADEDDRNSDDPNDRYQAVDERDDDDLHEYDMDEVHEDDFDTDHDDHDDDDD